MATASSFNVAYLGPETSFSHQAALEFFKSSTLPVTLHPLPSFTSIFSALQASSPSSLSSSSPGPDSDSASAPPTVYDYALIPIENSTNGSVVQVFDLLARTGHADPLYPDLEVVAEHYLSVHHCVFVRGDADPALTFADIATLHTHPQVWGQCARFLRAQLPEPAVTRVDEPSTSAAARLVASSPPGAPVAAAIASRLAGERYALRCLAADIEDQPGSNATRFLVMRNERATPPPLPAVSPAPGVAPTPTPTQTLLKSLVTFTVVHGQAGALAGALAVFARHGLNLTSIDTRPGRRRSWQYVFFVECESAEGTGSGDDDDDEGHVRRMERVLAELKEWTESLRRVGTFVDMLPPSTE